MLRFAVLFALAAVVLGAATNPARTLFDHELDNLWEQFKAKHNKVYEPQEENVRRLIWERAVHKIVKHNLEADLGMHTYKLGINKFADMPNAEFRRVMNGYRRRNVTNGSTFLAPSHFVAPDEVDWRKEGLVTEVKNQAQCGSCWAFSATGSLEGQHKKKTGKLVSLSEQNLMDCSKAEGNQGCNGGAMDNAFEYIIKNKGIDTEDAYPYEAQDGRCRFKRQSVGATCTGYQDIPSGDEKALKHATATVGPISVAIDASSDDFQYYSSGVYVDRECSSSELDHGVLVVGYGSENGKNYWLVKNSWGAEWGESGYIKMAKDHDNMCGIATEASYPLV